MFPISGRGKTVGYFISANYYDKECIIIILFQKYIMRMNLDGKYERLKFGLNFSPSYSTSNRVDASGSNGIVQSALMMPPVWPVYNSDGSYNYQGNGYWRIGNDYQHNAVLNPVAMANLQSDVVDRMAIVGKVFAELELFKGLTYNISFGGDYYGSHNDQYRSSELPLLGQKYYDIKSNPTAYSSSGFYFNWLIENKINYNTVINEDHSINAVLVQSAQKETYKGDNVTATDFPNVIYRRSPGGTVIKGASDKTQWSNCFLSGSVMHIVIKVNIWLPELFVRMVLPVSEKITAGDISRPHHWHGELAGRISSRRRNFSPL